MAQTGKRVDPYGSFNFKVEIDGIVRAYFREVSGIDSSVEVMEYREGGDPTTRKLPTIAKYSNITLKWGLTDERELYDWHRKAVRGQIERKNGSIIVLDSQGREAVRWNFFNAWPTRYNAADLNAEGNDVAIETLELAHEGIEVA